MRYFYVTLMLAALLSLSIPVRAADPIEVLKSDASLEAKGVAFRQLAQTGDLQAIPVLAALLTDAQLAHMARYALEPMPYPEAGAALREALDNTSGLLKAGIISSLGIRKDVQALPALIALLGDQDLEVAQAAAKALGEIGGRDAVKALKTTMIQSGDSPAMRQASCNALLSCAEILSASENQGDRQSADDLYQALYQNEDLLTPVRAAALKALILNRAHAPWPEDASASLPWLTEAIRDGDTPFFLAALRAAREWSDCNKAAPALAELLPSLPSERKIRLIETLADCGADAAAPAMLHEAKEGPVEVRTAALLALTRLAYVPALDLLQQLVVAGDEEMAKAARNALNYFPGEERTGVLKAMLINPDSGVRLTAIEMIARGGIGNPVPVLMNVAETAADEESRVAALAALRDRVSLDEAPWLLDKLLKARSSGEVQAAERVLQALCSRQRRGASGRIVIEKALYGALPDGPSADVTAKVAGMVQSGASSVTANNANFGDTAPNLVKQLQIDYTEDDASFSQTVTEGETLRLGSFNVPAVMVDAFCAALDQAEGEKKLAILRLVGATGAPKALDAVRAAATSADPGIRDTALRLICDWPTPDAMPIVMEILSNHADTPLETPALRGAVRMLGQSTGNVSEVLGHYTALMQFAKTPADKKLVLSGLAKISDAAALELVLQQFNDDAVKDEAHQAATAIASKLGQIAREEEGFFTGSLTGWHGNPDYWRCEEGTLVGSSSTPIPRNEFLWSEVDVRDFYLVLDVLLEPDSANAGIQFRSKKVDEQGQALGYQADMGKEVWGRLYHEHGRGKLDWTDRAEKAVKPGEWNRYEILAVGPAIWTAINGQLGVAFLDVLPEAERAGLIAFQVHAGPPQTARYRIHKLIHNPKVELENQTTQELIGELKSQ